MDIIHTHKDLSTIHGSPYLECIDNNLNNIVVITNQIDYI
jgi:hypothetical protein